MICLRNDSQLLNTVNESNAEMCCMPNICQTAGRVQYMCVVMTDGSQKEKISRESLAIQLTKCSVRREHVIAKAARPCKNGDKTLV
jgi:hypothetical protein